VAGATSTTSARSAIVMWPIVASSVALKSSVATGCRESVCSVSGVTNFGHRDLYTRTGVA
jgi:hypothetical protein